MNKPFIKLFESGQMGGMELKNRVIKAPQWTLLGARDGSVTERLIRYYKEIARGGTALIIVEYAFVDHKGSKASPCELGIADNEYIPGLSLLAQAIQTNGARAALQIVHCGRQRSLGPPIKAPSRIPLEGSLARGWPVPEELTFEEIREIVSAFGNAARRAQIAGFDMVEIHGAHGYLISSFLSPRTNKRTDAYGGPEENRWRFLLEILEDIRQKLGASFPVGVRLNGTDYEPGGVMIEDTVALAEKLEKLGLDVVHISGGTHYKRLMRMSTMSLPPGLMVWAAEAVKKAVSIPVIASGSITTPELAEEILEKGKADFVSLGRPLFADPYWTQKAKEGRPEEIAPCIRCNDGCFQRSMSQFKAILCTVNVALGKEDELGITPAKNRKKVAVIGGGPAGMEAARVCALSGHEVTLYEKRQLGGTLIEASAPEFKADLKRLLNYFTTQIGKLNIQVIDQEATADTIRKGGFEAAIVATGGSPISLDVPGADRPVVSSALDVLNGKVQVGQKVLVVGGGVVGTETGLFLAEQGKEVIFVEVLDEFMNGVGLLDQMVYQERLDKQKVTIHTGKRVETVFDKGAVIVDGCGNREEVSADSVVVAIGFTPQITLAQELEKDPQLEVYTVGDCVNPRKLFDAIREGYLSAYSIG
jgi:2,4-dienoyl-CoA reductase-like NADH-dependent reductase (Old Yellow Enzyme family)/thioredoxin reductase